MAQNQYAYADQLYRRIVIAEVELNLTGTYSGSTGYVSRDAIEYGGSKYVALTSVSGIAPVGNHSDYWSALALLGPYEDDPFVAVWDEIYAVSAIASSAQSEASFAVYLAGISTDVGTNALAIAKSALAVAQTGTATADAAYSIAVAGTNLGLLALTWLGTNEQLDESIRQVAWWGTDLAQAAYDLALNGTSAGYALSVAESALAVAWTGTNLAQAAYDLANIGTNLAQNAYDLACSGTSGVTQVYQIAVSGTNLAQQAYDLACSGTSGVTQVYQIAVNGTNLAQQAYDLALNGTSAGYALSVAESALAVAWTGTNLAQDAYDLACIGTNLAQAAYTLAEAGTSTALNGAPSPNLSSSGPSTNTFQAGTAITAMDLVYMGTHGKWLHTDASTISSASGFLAISLENKADTQIMNVALSGAFIRNDAWVWTPGAVLYVDPTTVGQVSTTQATGTDTVIRVIGFAASANAIFFNPSQDYVTHI